MTDAPQDAWVPASAPSWAGGDQKPQDEWVTASGPPPWAAPPVHDQAVPRNAWKSLPPAEVDDGTDKSGTPADAPSGDEGAATEALRLRMGLPATPAPDEEQKGEGLAVQALKRGIREGITETAQAAHPFTDQPAATASNTPLDAELSKSFLAGGGWKDPEWYATHIAEGLGKSSPSMALGVAGGVAGTAMAGPAGGLVGGAGGFGVGSAVQALGPAYQAARAQGLDHNAAVDQAWRESGIAGVFGAAMGAAPGVSTVGRAIEDPAKAAIGDALANIFGVTPAIGAAQQVASAVDTGKPLTAEDLASGYAQNVGVGVAASGAHAAPHVAEAVGNVIAPLPASPDFLAAQAKLRELAGMPPAPGQGAAVGAAQPDQAAASLPSPEAAPGSPPGTPQAPAWRFETVSHNPFANPDPAPAADAPAPLAGDQVHFPQPPQPADLPPASSDMQAGGPDAPPPSDEATPRGLGDAPYTMLRPGDLKRDPQRFQFKTSDDNGVTGALNGVQRWEPALASPVTAWRDTDGQLWIVNGHQRHDLATRAEAAGQPDVQIPARIYDAADGATPQDMRTLGAYQNISEGSGSALDAAKVMRAPPPPGMVPPDLPPKSALVQQARGLSSLSDEAFGAVANGVIPAPYGAEIGAAITDPLQQLAAVSMLHKLDPANVEQARIMVQDIRNSGFLAGAQQGLFGEEQFASSLFGERAKVLAGALQNLRGARGAFKAAVTGEDVLTAAGNRMNTDANQRGQSQNEQLIQTLQRDATTRGPLSDALNDAARAVAGGKQVRGAVADFLTQARVIARRAPSLGVERGVGDGGAGSADERGQAGADAAVVDAGTPPAGQDAFFAQRQPGGNSAALADPATIGPMVERVMRYSGLPPGVGLRFVDHLQNGTADGAYAHSLITMALDTPPSQVPSKLFHETVHALRDPALDLLKPGERAALDQAANNFLRLGTNRTAIEARYPGADAATIHEEAIARLAEQALTKAESQPAFITRLADRMRNFVVGLGQALRGQGFTTADDVFRALMTGDRATPEARAALAEAVRGKGVSLTDTLQRPAGQSIPDAARQVQSNTPDTYFARRAPLMTDKQGLEREGQGAMFGRQDAAVQAQAARDAAGGLRSDAPQKPADEGLFAPKQSDQGALFSLRPGAEKRAAFPEDFPHVAVQQPFGASSRPTTHPDYRAAKAGDEDAAARFVAAHVTPQGLAAVRKMAGSMRPTLVPVHAEEASGRNAIPSTYATYLSRHLNLPLLRDIVQANRALRTGASQMHRMSTPVEFEGPVVAGKRYLLVDDHVSQGGTMADLRAYIENRGGKVVGATALTGAPDAHILAASPKTLAALRAKMPGIDEWVKGAFGHDLEGLTELEARYLSRSNSLNSLRNQFVAERSASQGGEGSSDIRQDGSGAEGGWGGVDPSSDKPQYSIRDQTRDDQGRFPLPSGPLQTKIAPIHLPDAPIPAATKGAVREAYEGIRDMAANGARQVSDAIFPMTSGSKEAQTLAFKFANAQRGIAYRYRKLDTMIAAQFSPAERTAMGRALDAQSVFEQHLRENLKQLPQAEQAAHEQEARATFDAGKTGMAGLTDKQRGTVEALNQLSQATWQRMAARGIVKPGADGLPYYMPRSFVMNDAQGVRRLTSKDRRPDLAGPRPDTGGASGGGAGLNGFHDFGRNLSTSGPRARNYLTPEESTAAAKAKFGDNAELVTDIRSLLSALSRNERSIAGRDFVDAIARYGEAAHVPAVAEGNNPDEGRFFTLADHPSLSRWQPKMAQGADGTWGVAKAPDGSTVFERAPIHISSDFRGPLDAVLSKESPVLYKGAMQVKSALMHLIMFSPFIHLSVEIGRALPAMPGKVLTGRVFVDGHRGLSDDAFMAQAIKEGLAPIAQGWSQDPATIADQQINPYGKNKVTRAIGGAKDAVARNMEKFGGQLVGQVAGRTAGQTVGQLAGSAIRDPHQTLLWRNVLKLQVGIYKNARDAFIAKGLPPEAAGTAAAHVANRYAGALPPENLHRNVNMLANLTMFSRSFTLGNLGVMKDALNGAPSHVLAAIEAAGGDRATAQNLLARKAKNAVIMDVGLHYIGTSLLQSSFAVAAKLGALGLTGAVAAAYEDWRDKALASLQHVGENPLEAFGVLPQHHNEPGKQDRAFLGTDASGRGTYGRVMFGKVGEEMLGWVFHPATMILNKENPLLSGMVDVINNSDSLGRKVYPSDPKTMGDGLRDAGLAIEHLFGKALPMQAIENVRDLAAGLHTQQSALQLAGQIAGAVQMSQGNPGGPQAGIERAAKERAEYEYQATMPAAHRMAEAGNRAGAEALIRSANLSDADKAQMIARLGLPPGPSRKAMRNFMQGALSSEQRTFDTVNH